MDFQDTNLTQSFQGVGNIFSSNISRHPLLDALCTPCYHCYAHSGQNTGPKIFRFLAMYPSDYRLDQKGPPERLG